MDEAIYYEHNKRIELPVAALTSYLTTYVTGSNFGRYHGQISWSGCISDYRPSMEIIYREPVLEHSFFFCRTKS